MASNDEIDIEILISLVEARPVLWDKTSEIYKDRNETKKAWKEVCTELKNNFEELEDMEKNTFDKEVMKKWSNIRDAFQKSRKKQKESSRSGAGASIVRQYIYHDQLQFLNKVFAEWPTHDSLSTDMDQTQRADAGSSQQASDEITENGVGTLKVPRKEMGSRKRKIDPIEQKIIQALDERPDRHLSFLKGIIPSLRTFNEDDVIEFQLGVLQLISNIKQQRKNLTEKPAPLSHQQTFQPIPPNNVTRNQQILPLNPHEIHPLSSFNHHQSSYNSSASQLLCQSISQRHMGTSQQLTATSSIYSPSRTPSPALSVNSSTLDDSIDFTSL